MDTRWVPIAREVPIRARNHEEEKWLLSGGEAEGAFMRELPQKQYGEKTEDHTQLYSCLHTSSLYSRKNQRTETMCSADLCASELS